MPARGARSSPAGGGRISPAHISSVRAPTLLIVGGRDQAVLDLNRDAARQLRSALRLEIVPDATHLFEEPGCASLDEDYGPVAPEASARRLHDH
jgi:putative phosphoribosyl transferase